MSVLPVTVSVTLSVVDFELSGMTLSWISVENVSTRIQALKVSMRRTVGEILGSSVSGVARHLDGVFVGWFCVFG